MHDVIESYCVTQAIFGRDAKFFKQGNKDLAAFKLESIMFHQQHVIISNEWFLLYVQDRYVKKVTSMLVKAGTLKEDLSIMANNFGTKIYVIQHPDKFIPWLMKFEQMIDVRKQNT